jgi:hypothetical protein
MTTLTAAAAVSTASTAASQKGEWKSFEMEKDKNGQSRV